MTMRIRMSGFGMEPPEWLAAELAAVERVLRSGYFILGPEVAAFEKAWARTCGVRHAVGVANGMDAIEIGLRALGIGAGDEVITTPMTAFASVLAIIRSGATPVLADIDPDTALLDAASVRRCVTRKTRAVLLVHLYGRIHDMDQWSALASECNIALLEDCAQAHLAQHGGRVAGSFGSFGAFSFYPTKNLATVGDGGALTTDTEDLARVAAQLRNYGQSTRYLHPLLGLNSRLDELHAAILSTRLAQLSGLTARRRRIAERYWDGIAQPRLRLLRRAADPLTHVHHLFVVTTDDRERFMAHLHEQQIDTLIHYPVCVHQQDSCRGSLTTDPAGLGRAEAHARSCVSLPCHPLLSDTDIARVIDAVNSYA